MVCKKCEKTLSKSSAPDPFRNRNAAGFLVASGSGAAKAPAAGPTLAASSSGGRQIGQNKLLSKANRFNPMGSKCKLCKGTVTLDKATYCQGCAYKKGLCAICGKQILDTTKYKQSSA
ncbi:hypothetical protein ACQY0O_003785 [Thecaphora frezii]